MQNHHWLRWRNMDTTECPSHGLVRLFRPNPGNVPNGGVVDPTLNEIAGVGPHQCANEVFGAQIVLHGIRPAYDFVHQPDALNRGILSYMGFNGDAPVAPGELGLMTFELPAWGVVDFVPNGSRVRKGLFVTVLDDWKLHYHDAIYEAEHGPLREFTGLMYVFGIDSQNKRVLVNKASTYRNDGEIF